MINIDNQKLLHFITLAETRHFHRASQGCNISASTMSRSIQQLEESLQCQLVERTKRSVKLTEQGRQFLEFARDNLEKWELIATELNSGSAELRGSLSMYCSVTASYSFLYDILHSFRQEFKKIEIVLHTGDPAYANERVSNGLDDFAITARDPRMPKQLSFKRIAKTPLTLITSKNSRDVKEKKIHWASLPMIVAERGLARERLDAWFRRKKISPNIFAQVSGHEAIVSMVSLGLGVGLVPQIVADNSPLKGEVKKYSTQLELGNYEVGICVQEKRLSNPLIKAFWSQIPDA